MEKPTRKATVVLLINKRDEVCLSRKKQPIHHEGGSIEYSLETYNGYGGKQVTGDQTIFDTAIRELFDESGVVAIKDDLEYVARVYFYRNKEGEEFEPFMDVSFFFLREWSGVPKESVEMGAPTFFSQDAIPYNEMMPADKILFEKMFNGERGVYEVILFGKNIRPEVRLLDENLV